MDKPRVKGPYDMRGCVPLESFWYRVIANTPVQKWTDKDSDTAVVLNPAIKYPQQAIFFKFLLDKIAV